MPCSAKHLLSGVLSITPGNFLAEKTWNGSEKTDARTGAEPWLRTGCPFSEGAPTLTKFILRLEDVSCIRGGQIFFFFFRWRGNIPEDPLSPHAQVLQDEPHADLVIRIRQAEGTRAQAADQVAREHAPGSRDGLLRRRLHVAAGRVVLRVVCCLRILVRQLLRVATVVAVHGVADGLAVGVLLRVHGVGRGEALRRRRIRRGGGRGYRGRGRGMSDEVDFAGSFSVPQVDGEDVERGVDFAVESAPEQTGIGSDRTESLLDVNLFFRLRIIDDQTDARRRGDGSPILCRRVSQPSRDEKDPAGRPLTLSPKPHMRARMGCCTTWSDQMRPSCLVETGARWSTGPLWACCCGGR